MNYIVGTPFRSNYGIHTTGEEISEEIARTWPRIETLVNTGRLYRIVEDGDMARLPGHIAKAVKTRTQIEEKLAVGPSQAEYTKPQQVLDAEKFLDDSAASRALASKEQHKVIKKAEAGVQRDMAVDTPVENKLPKGKITEDSMKAKAQEQSTDFDPEAVRTMKLDDLKEEARKRGLPVSGNKPELAQRVIDDEIAKAKTPKAPEEETSEEETPEEEVVEEAPEEEVVEEKPKTRKKAAKK